MKLIILFSSIVLFSIDSFGQGFAPTVTTQPPVNEVVCTGTTGYLTMAGTNVSTYQWRTSAGVALTNGTNYSGVTTATLGINTTGGFGNGALYYCHIANGYGSANTNNGSLQLHALPAAPGATNGFTCGPGPVALNASGGTNGEYRWYLNSTGGQIAGQTNSLYTTPSLSTTVNYDVSINDGTCEGPQTLIIATVYAIPAAPGATGNAICGSGTVTLNATGGSAGQYKWYTAAGVVIAGQTNSSYTTPTIATTTNYSVSIFNGNCESTKTSVTATVNPLPTAPGATGNSSCGSAAITLNATGGTAGQYRWYNSSGTQIAGQTNSAYTTPVLATTTSYSVTINNGTCESTKTAVTATINTIPAAPTATGNSACGSSALALNASGGSAGQYRWYTAAGTLIAGQTNSLYTTPVLTTTTNYSVSINNGLCEGAKTPVTATINTIPGSPTATGNSACGAGALTLNASGGSAGQYRWYTAAGTIIAGQTNSSYVTPVLSATTNYSVSINNGICESATTPVTATINNIPAAPSATGNASCGPGALTLNASGGTSGQYRWYNGGVLIAGQTSNAYMTPVISATTNYSVSINNGICESAQTAVVATINNPPSAPGATSNYGCGTSTVTLNANGGAAGQYRWYAGGVLINGQTSSSYTTPTLSVTTNYTVSINNGTCESAQTPVTATIKTPPSAPTATGASSCSASALTLTAAGGTDGQYRWYNNDGTSIAGQLNSSFTTPVISTPTQYFVSINDGSCESAQTSVLAQINSAPSAPTVVGASSCGPGAISLTASGASDGQYRWYTDLLGATGISGAVNGAFVTPVISATTTYYVSINNGTCESGRTAVVALVNTIPAAPTVTGNSNCIGLTVALTAAGGSDGQYMWYTTASGGTSIDGETSSSYTTPDLETTTIYYVAINDGTCESVRTPVTATVTACKNSPPVINTVTTITVPGGSATIDLRKHISDPDGNLDYSTLRVVTAPISGASYSIDGNGDLTLDYSGLAFAGTDSLMIEICDLDKACTERVFKIDVDGNIVVFSGISPNNDQVNDTWFIGNIESLPSTKSNHVTIFDRWGDVIFDVDNYDNNGTIFSGLNKSGGQVPSGIYFYKIDYTSGRKADTGYLSLKR